MNRISKRLPFLLIILLLCPLAVSAATGPAAKTAAPRIITASSSYAPGSTVRINASNFPPGEAVAIRVFDARLLSTMAMVGQPVSAKVDAFGQFAASWYYAPNTLGSLFRVEATSQSGQRAATFFRNTNVAGTLVSSFYSGWYNLQNDPIHESTNTNVIVGSMQYDGYGVFRNFAAFNLSGITGTVTSATIHYVNHCTSVTWDGGPPVYSFFLSDVTTPLNALSATWSQPNTTAVVTGIYGDLASGKRYGVVYFPPLDMNASVIDVPLNAYGIAAVNASLGKTLIVGGATTGDGWFLGCGGGLTEVQLDLVGASRPVGQ